MAESVAKFVHRCPAEAFDHNAKRCRACGLSKLDLMRIAQRQAPDSVVLDGKGKEVQWLTSTP